MIIIGLDPGSQRTGYAALELRPELRQPRIVEMGVWNLLELTRGDESESFDRAIDVQIHRLRRLIEEDPAHPRYLQTVWGVGYVFVPDSDAAAESDS